MTDQPSHTPPLSGPPAALAGRVTLKDVARRAEVSVMTVSNVINGRAERVSAEVAARVREVIDAMGYRPQMSGRSLRLQRNFAIGLIVRHPDRRFLDDPFITQVAAGMSNRLADFGYGLMIHGTQDVEDVERLVVRPHSYDGFAVMASGARDERQHIYGRLARKGLPMLILQDRPPASLPQVSCVLQDDEDGAGALAEQLIASGARRLLCLTPSRIWPAIERRAAGIVRATMGRAEVSFLTCPEADFEGTVRQTMDWLGSNPQVDAVMGGTDQLGLAAVHAADRLGLKVPDDLQVTGFNAFEMHKFSAPTLASAASPAYEIGKQASRILYEQVEGQNQGAQSVELPVRPVPGGTLRSTLEDSGPAARAR